MTLWTPVSLCLFLCVCVSLSLCIRVYVFFSLIPATHGVELKGGYHMCLWVIWVVWGYPHLAVVIKSNSYHHDHTPQVSKSALCECFHDCCQATLAIQTSSILHQSNINPDNHTNGQTKGRTQEALDAKSHPRISELTRLLELSNTHLTSSNSSDTLNEADNYINPISPSNANKATHPYDRLKALNRPYQQYVLDIYTYYN